VTASTVSVQAEPGLFAPRIFLPFMLVSLIWGSTWLVIRDQIHSVPAAWSVCYRFSVAAVGMFILARVMKLPIKLDRQGQRWAMLLGGLQFALNFNFVYAAEHHITSGLVAVLFALLIMPNAILGQWWLGRKVARSFWLGSAIATAGVTLLILREYRIAPVGGTQVLIGTALTLTGVLCASISNVVQASSKVSYFPIVTMLAWAMLWGALANAAFAWTMHGAPVIEMRSGYFAGVLYLGVVGSVITFPLYFGLIREIGPGKAAYSSVFIPVVAMALSTVFEGYAWSPLAIAGAALAMIGLLIAMQARKA
jgi:drug/metabolite transporter (DMT)-like permease